MLYKKLSGLLSVGAMAASYALFSVNAHAESGSRICVSTDNKFFTEINKKNSSRCGNIIGYKAEALTCEDFSKRFTRWADYNICNSIPKSGRTTFNKLNPKNFIVRNGTIIRSLGSRFPYSLREHSLKTVVKPGKMFGPVCKSSACGSIEFSIAQSVGASAGLSIDIAKVIGGASVDFGVSTEISKGITLTCGTERRNFSPFLRLNNTWRKFRMSDFTKKGASTCGEER